MEKPITAIVCGAGGRGKDAYGRYAEKHPEDINIIGVAEPQLNRRNRFANIHNILENRCYNSWEDMFSVEKFADAAIITTGDMLHTKPAIKALEMGYDVLLEKPMAPKLEECVQLVKKSEEVEKHLQICHVLRYTGFYSSVYDIIQSGRLGKLINIEMKENVSFWHFAHSFVRGLWRNLENAAPMILAKCCHDLDLLYWMVGVFPKKLSSVGNLLYYKEENAPPGAPKRCLDGCPHADNCIHFAPFLYIYNTPLLRIGVDSDWKLARFGASLVINHRKFMTALSKIIPPIKRALIWEDWPVSTFTDDFSYDSVMKELRNGPFGRCVYYCDNDVVDHQIVAIEFENGVTASLTVHGVSAWEGRTIRVDGSKATLIGEFLASGEKLWLYDSLSGEKELVFSQKLQLIGHGGGDTGLMNAFVDLMRNNISKSLTNARASLESHIMGFAAEKSRLENEIIDMAEYRKDAMNL
jgi:predicted dehydrogenase